MAHPLTLWRERKGLTRADLAERLHVTYQRVRQIETGRSASASLAAKIEAITSGEVRRLDLLYPEIPKL